MRLIDWEQALEEFLALSELPKLRGAGSVSAKDAERMVHERYAEFDAKRKEAERRVADETEGIEELKRIADAATGHKSGAERPDDHAADAGASNP